MDRNEEHRLIRLAAAGDNSAAENLIRAHQQSVCSYLLRLSGRRDVAEDLTQEAFVRALTHLGGFDTRFRFSTWIFTIARNLYMNACARKKAVNIGDGLELCEDRRAMACDPGAGADAADSTHYWRDSLQHAMMGLSLTHRDVLVLFHQQNWPIWLIAEHLGLPQGTVKSHLHRARRHLREILVSMSRSKSAEEAQESWT